MYIKITTTTSKKKNAKEISKEIINLKYSPCVQINKIHSIYSWDKKIEESKEYKITIKTIDKHSKEIIKIIKSMNIYDIPQIVKSDFSIENKDYEKWFLENIKK